MLRFKKNNSREHPRESGYYNRLNAVLAIIFLFFGAMVVRLYKLQVLDYEEYAARADRQQRVYSELKPNRGEIFTTTYLESFDRSEDSPLAINKDYAEVYAVPKDIKSEVEASTTADVLYRVFNSAEVEADIDKTLNQENQKDLDAELRYVDSLSLLPAEKEAKKQEVRQRRSGLASDTSWKEFSNVKRTLEINDRRQELLTDYLSKLIKPDDPYESIRKKVSTEKLLDLYAALLSTEGPVVNASDLELKQGKIYKKGDDSQIYYELRGIAYSLQKYRYYPDGNVGSHLTGFVNLDNQGNYGLESYFNEELIGQKGFLKGDKAAGSGAVVAGNREYSKAVNGSSIVLSIDRVVQIKVCQMLNEAQKKYNFQSGTVIIVEPKTGAIIAMCSWPSFDPNDYQSVDEQKIFDNPAVSYQYEPGSVFKTITMAAAIDQGKVSPQTTYQDKGQTMINGWPKPIKNSDFETAGGHGTVDMIGVLEKSLNLGAIFSMETIGSKKFSEYVDNFGFGEKTGIELGAESSGNIKNLGRDKIREIDAATASFGQGIAVTPLQMVMSYAAIANGGILMKPYLVKEIIDADGNKTALIPKPVRRVISQSTSDTVRAMLVKVVDNGHSKLAGVKGYYVGAKTGTAQIPAGNGGYLENQYIHTLVGMAPADNPRFAMLVKLDRPEGIKFAESTAAPLFGDIAKFLLKYYQIPKQR